MVEPTEIVAYPEKLQTGEPLTLGDIKQNASLIKSLFKQTMIEGVDYGTTPGCKQPSLWKPGAEKAMLLFKLGCFPEPVDHSTEDAIKYVVKTKIVHLPSGIELGYGLGSCSSNETKYKWRRAVCDAEYECTPDDQKRLKWAADGTATQQIRTNPVDLNNTIIKMACKRSKIDGVITVTGASDIFSQDLEDSDGINRTSGNNKTALKKPQGKPLNASDFREMKSKYDTSKCKKCGKGIAKGDTIHYSKQLGTFCGDCMSANPGEPKAAPAGLATSGQIETLKKLAAEAGVNVVDLLGRDGYDSGAQLPGIYVNGLISEIATKLDEAKQ